MNITEVTTEGLRRELKVVIGAAELERRLSARLDDLKDRVKLKGFRLVPPAPTSIATVPPPSSQPSYSALTQTGSDLHRS